MKPGTFPSPLYLKPKAFITKQAVFESKLPASTHVIAIRFPGINPDQKPKQAYLQELTNYYYLAQLRACLKAAGIQVIEIEHLNKDNNYEFVRDLMVVLHNLKLILLTPRPYRDNEEEVIKQYPGYKVLKVEDAYIEGGNAFYDPNRKILLHGLNPIGQYVKTPVRGHPGKNLAKDSLVTTAEWDLLKKEVSEENYRTKPTATNLQLQKALKEHKVSVVGIELNKELLNFHVDANQKYYRPLVDYHHLDCFMQLLPDGRLLILNKKMLSEKSQKLLQEKYGDKFIDLGYPDFITKPFTINFIATTNNGATIVVSPPLPKYIHDALKQLGLTVITPQTLDASSAYYDSEFAEKVAKELKEAGYFSASSDNLGSHIAVPKQGYKCQGGEDYPTGFQTSDEDFQRPFLRITEGRLNENPTKEQNAFWFNKGGPHCLTIDVVPPQPISIKNEVQPKEAVNPEIEYWGQNQEVRVHL